MFPRVCWACHGNAEYDSNLCLGICLPCRPASLPCIVFSARPALLPCIVVYNCRLKALFLCVCACRAPALPGCLLLLALLRCCLPGITELAVMSSVLLCPAFPWCLFILHACFAVLPCLFFARLVALSPLRPLLLCRCAPFCLVLLLCLLCCPASKPFFDILHCWLLACCRAALP